MGLDETLLRAINQLASSPVMAWIGVALSSRWVLVLVGLPIIGWSIHRRRFVALASIVLSIGISDQLSAHLIKPWVARERPCRAMTGLETPRGCGSGQSFPSSHATNAFSLAVTAAPELPHGWAILIPIAVLVSLSRVLVGEHYPSDIAAGALVGALIGVMFLLIQRRLLRSRGGDQSSQSLSSP